MELRTDDPELIEVLAGVRNRARFVKRALKYFVSTKQGKETLKAMSKVGSKNPEREKVKGPQKTRESGSLPSDNIEKGGYDLDRFL